jgi:hypothetical protein
LKGYQEGIQVMKKISLFLIVILLGFAQECILAQKNQQKWDKFLDTLQERTIKYFLDYTDLKTGLTPDRAPSKTECSIAAVGYALTVYPIAVERKIITRKEAGERTLNTLKTLWSLPQNQNKDGSSGYHGFYYHFISLKDGTRVWNCELSSIDTGLLMAGILFVQSYFDKNDPVEKKIRQLADSLYRRVEWNWFLVKEKNGLSMDWDPVKGLSSYIWKGYNEAMILYFLALGSPTNPVDGSMWKTWTDGYIWAKYYDQEFISFGPLFGHHYSHCWIDFHGIQDEYMKAKGIDYSENTRRATYSQMQYAKENPLKYNDYSENIWGFSACDGPGETEFEVNGKLRKFQGYNARGVSFDWAFDDGTITPTAAGGSIAFAPELCIKTLKAMRNKYGDKVFRKYGFIDAFNPTFITDKTKEGWFDNDYIGIDQGPIAIMIENLRNGFVWNIMKKNPYIVKGLKRAGFKSGWLK